MAAKLTIIGLGQVGASIGLALAARKDLVTCTGHDKEYSVAQKAQKLGAVEKVNANLPSSVSDADIVILALPLNAIGPTLESIRQDLKDGVVVMDTAPVKAPVAKWVKQYLPEGRHYVGLVPALNSAYLFDTSVGLDAARADLFAKSVMGVVALPETSSDAIKLASDLCRLLSAEPFFIDMLESDSLMAKTHLLPQLASAALVHMTVDQPGWIEGRKMAGRAYTEGSAAFMHQDQLGALIEAALADKDNTLRALDDFTTTLRSLREAIANDNRQGLTDALDRAYEGRMRWWDMRLKGDWYEIEVGKPKAGDVGPGSFFRRMLVGKLGDKDK
jgi:prephenate dehydrogenase